MAGGAGLCIQVIPARCLGGFMTVKKNNFCPTSGTYQKTILKQKPIFDWQHFFHAGSKLVPPELNLFQEIPCKRR